MTCYEIVSTVISILSLIATIIFSIAVWRLSNKANKIAEESNKLQQKQIDKKQEYTMEQFTDPKILNDFKKTEKQLPIFDKKEASKK